MIQESKLSISVHDAEFSKDYQYMVTAQFEQQKVEICLISEIDGCLGPGSQSYLYQQYPHLQPSFSSHPSRLSYCKWSFIQFAAHMVLPSQEGRELATQSTRVLGECSLDLSPFALQPT